MTKLNASWQLFNAWKEVILQKTCHHLNQWSVLAAIISVQLETYMSVFESGFDISCKLSPLFSAMRKVRIIFQNVVCWKLYSECSALAHKRYFCRMRCLIEFFTVCRNVNTMTVVINLYHSLGIFSRRQNDVIFLIFPRKQDLTFHANCLLRRQFAWNVKSCFLGKIRKIFQNVVCWKFFPEC